MRINCLRVKLCFTISVLLALITTGVHGQESSLIFQHISSKDGLHANIVYSPFIDSRGLMWILTNSGLFRYDGYKMEAFRYDPNDSLSLAGNHLISIPYEDEQGFIWFGASDGTSVYNRYNNNFRRYYHIPGDTSSIGHDHVHHFYYDKDGILWALTMGGGLSMYNETQDNFTTFKVINDSVPHRKNLIFAICEAPDEAFWVGTGDGMFEFNKRLGKFQKLSQFPDCAYAYFLDQDKYLWIGTYGYGLLKYDKLTQNTDTILFPASNVESYLANRVMMIIQDVADDNILWLTTFHGLIRFNKITFEWYRFEHNENDPASIGYKYLWGACMDNSALLWIGKESGGLDILNTNQIIYNKCSVESKENKKYAATSFFKDADGALFIGTSKGGVFHIDTNLNVIDRISTKILSSNTLDYIFSLNKTTDTTLWIGTQTKGLFLYDLKNKKLKKVTFSPETIRPAYISQIYKDKDGIIWVCTHIGLFRKFPQRDLFEYCTFSPDFLLNDMVRSISEDLKGNIWIGSEGQGLLKINREDKDELIYTQFLNDPTNPSSLSSNRIMSTYVDINGELWIGTDQGLNRLYQDSAKFERFDSRHGFDLDHIFHIEGGMSRELYMTTNKGLVRFDPPVNNKEGQLKPFTIKEGFPYNDVYRFSFLISDDHLAYLGPSRGTGDGFIYFPINKIISNEHIPPLVITYLRAGNQSIVLDSNILEKKKISLPYNQNNLSIEFAALDYVNPEQNQYAYRMEGLNNEWVITGNNRTAHFAAIPPGSYKFRVKGSNNDLLWNNDGTSLSIVIAPPPWKTWWAYSLYGLLLIIILYFLRLYDLKRQRLKQSLELERIESDKLKELDQMKSKFFANISHEFRTPLTLILGPLNELSKESISDSAKQGISIIQRNALRLQRLINQLLSLSKLESGKMVLKASKVNIVKFVREYGQLFESLAKQKKIALEFNGDKEDIELWVDIEKMENILYNLISNAFKYSTSGGRIVILVESKNSGYRLPVTGDRQENVVLISVHDSGSGIPEDKIEHIFERFYQADDTYRSDEDGTGIGLALTKELVELHQGSITVESKLGEGSTFRMFFRSGSDHLNAESLEPVSESLSPMREKEIDVVEAQNDVLPADPQEKYSDDRSMILVVEDNSDLRLYLRSQLIDSYQVIEANNGENGLRQAVEYIPDLIITDVMMPVMDGFELCHKIKSDERTSHIPVIMLTAMAGMENKIEGLETGADDFIIKPYDAQELKVRTKNLIDQRKKLRDHFQRQFTGIESEKPQITVSIEQDRENTFLDKASRIVEKNLVQENFSVEDLSSELAMSRSQLHRKLKAIINNSASEFIRNVRLKKAASHLREGKFNVSQVAYEVGFNNLSYFSKCFHQIYGKLPSEFMNEKES